MPRPGVSKGGPLKNCEGFHVAEAQGVKHRVGEEREEGLVAQTQ